VPELPEVETTRRGIVDHLCGAEIADLVVRVPKLRWPISPALPYELRGEVIRTVERRGKYLLLRCVRGTLLYHLGMSGSLQLVPPGRRAGPHDHVDLVTGAGPVLRLTDPRKFGAVLWVEGDPLKHPLLRDQGPEPLTADFDGAYLLARSRGRSRSVKAFIMDSKVVPGVGNIYANEALFQAGIRPSTPAGWLGAERCDRLAASIKEVLIRAIAAGGTSLRDFVGGDGRPGYFSQQLQVYGRGGEPCNRCRTRLVETRQEQRSTVFCRHCQR